MRKKFFLPLLVAVTALAFTSCGKLKPLAGDYIKAEPQPLEAIGGEVPVTINATFPAKWFNKKAVVTVTPVLRYEGGEVWGTPYTYQGEKISGNALVIPQATGANVTLKSAFPFKDALKKSELFLSFDAKLKGKAVQLPEIKIGDGVLATSEWASVASAKPAIAPDKFQRIIKEAHSTNILFLIQQAELRSKELSKQEVADWKALVKSAHDAPNQNVAVEISAYASPDGGVKLNTGLAEKRETNTEKFLANEFKKGKVTAPIDAHYTAQDWEGFQELVSKSDIQDKDLVLRVLSMYSDPEQREQEIKNISATFKVLAEEILPQLRRSRLTANIEIIGKSDEEISELFKTNPSELSLEEILYAATLTNIISEKEAIYKKTVEFFPSDHRAWNNIGVTRFLSGDFAGAEQLFIKANSVKVSPEANLNLALIALSKGDKAKAQQLLGDASGVPELPEALGLLYLKQGEYVKAVNSFGGIKSDNAALAQILTKDYSKAQQTLNAVEHPTAITDYLKAVVAARTNNSASVFSNLKAAFNKKESLKVDASKDLEFAKYSTNNDFKALF
jgi:hypothetical protein